MTVHREEQWVRIAELDAHDQIHFTAEFQSLMGELEWEAKAFVGHLFGLWYDPHEHLLDYSIGLALLAKAPVGGIQGWRPGLYPGTRVSSRDGWTQ